jgi:hypothetical protein
MRSAGASGQLASDSIGFEKRSPGLEERQHKEFLERSFQSNLTKLHLGNPEQSIEYFPAGSMAVKFDLAIQLLLCK